MTVIIDKINGINEIVKEIFEFTQNNDKVKADFDEYLATVGARNISLNQMEKIFLPYIFERKIDNKSILEMYKEEKGQTQVLDSLIKAQASIFEIKKILKNGFELYNLINEKTLSGAYCKNCGKQLTTIEQQNNLGVCNSCSGLPK